MPPTGSVSFVDLDQVLPLVPGTTLGASTIDLSLVRAQVKAPIAAAAPADLRFVVQAGSELTLRALNESDATDPDRVVAVGNAATPSGELAPQVHLTPDHAWLKYGLTAQASATASAEAGWFSAAVTGAGTVECGDYRRHHKDTMALSAIETDLRNGVRFAVSLDHVLALAPGDALSLRVAGELTARVAVSWSDIFSSQLGTLTRAIKGSAAVGITSSLAAKVQASVKVTDRFVLVFSRLDDTRWRVALKKAELGQLDFGAQAGVSVQIDNPEEVPRMLNQLIGELLGMPFTDLQGLLSQSSFTQEQLEKLADLFRRLGLDPAPTVALVKKALARFEAEVQERVVTIAKEKITLAFQYEYRRVSTDAVLFQALLTRAAIEANHSQLARGVLRGLIQMALEQPSPLTGPVVVEQYLNEKRIATERAWGFTLGVGKWKLTGRDRRSVVAIRRHTFDQLHEQRAYTGLGAYEADVLGEQRAWQVDFSAEMPRFSIGPVPRFGEYRFGLSLAWDERNRRFDADDVEQAADFAVLWGICVPEQAEQVRAMLEPLRDKDGVDWSVQLRINDEALRAVAAAMAAGDRTQFAGAFAAAMRARRDGPGMSGPTRRRALYAPVWSFYLDADEEPTPSDVSQRAQSHLRTVAPLAAFHEQNFARVDGLLTAAGTAALNPNARAQIDDFLRGMQLFATACERDDADLDVVPRVYKRLAGLWTQSHHVRALGVRLLDAARQVNQLKGIERTLTATREGVSITISSNLPGAA